MSSSQDLTTPKKKPTKPKTPSITTKSVESGRPKALISSAKSKLNREYYEANAAHLRRTAAARYKARSDAERSEVRWRQEAKPPTPQPGSKRHANPRLVALANAYCDFSDLEEVIRTYIACAIMNELGWGEYHCDHTVPITSRLVCGLHTHTNIRVISVRENYTKRNAFWPQMWSYNWDAMDLLLADP